MMSVPRTHVDALLAAVRGLPGGAALADAWEVAVTQYREPIIRSSSAPAPLTGFPPTLPASDSDAAA